MFAYMDTFSRSKMTLLEMAVMTTWKLVCCCLKNDDQLDHIDFVLIRFMMIDDGLNCLHQGFMALWPNN